jgi:hypothetical protein
MHGWKYMETEKVLKRTWSAKLLWLSVTVGTADSKKRVTLKLNSRLTYWHDCYLDLGSSNSFTPDWMITSPWLCYVKLSSGISFASDVMGINSWLRLLELSNSISSVSYVMCVLPCHELLEEDSDASSPPYTAFRYTSWLDRQSLVCECRLYNTRNW